MRIYYVSQPEAKNLQPNKFYTEDEAVEKAKELSKAFDKGVRIKVNADGEVFKLGTVLPDGTYMKVGEEKNVVKAVAMDLKNSGNEKFAEELEKIVGKL